MLFSALPSTNLRPSVVCLGVADFGTRISREESFAILDTFAESGGNFADSAHIYAAWVPEGWGKSERTLGEWLQSRRPQGFLVGTKGGHPEMATMEISRLAPEAIEHDLNESLERLQLSSVSLYWLHRDDPQVPVGEIVVALNELLTSGRVGALGASNWSTTRIEEANRYAAAHNLTGFCASQIGWSLAWVNDQARGAANTIQMDEETLRWHRATRFPQIAYSSQANGFFATPLPTPGVPLTPKQQALSGSYFSEENVLRYGRAQQLGERLGRTAHEVALAYVWSQSFPSIAIMGSSTRTQLEASLRATDLRLSTEDVAFLEGATTA
jgi:aryl-alcohol dehydrogenase-like predicted oxidoreductase